MVLFMIINLLSGVNPSVVRADETKTWEFNNNGETAGNQQVKLVETGVKSTYQDGKFDVKLEVEGRVETLANNEKMDVVLVVDRSGSMNSDNRMDNAKTAAKSFVDKLLDGGNGKVRIGLVSYAGRSAVDRTKPDLTITKLQSDKNNLKKTIDSYNGDGGTFTQAALREADKLFDNSNSKKIIVLISDGEPTYSYGFQPDFRYREKAYSKVEKKGYEIWSVPVNENGEYDFGKWKKGYKTSSYRGGLFWLENWTYVPHYVKIVNNKIEGEGDKTSEDDKTRTIAEAKSIKAKGIRIFSVGIGVNEVGKEILTKVASTNHYNDANKSASDLSGLLSEIADQLRFSVSNADLELVMNDKVEFKNADDLKKIEVKVINNKTNSEITSKSNAIKNSAKWNETSKTLAFSGITLDKDEVLNIKYNAELVETHKDGEFKPLNAKAVLYPKGKVAEPNNVLNFIIPNVKDMKTVNLTINKQWVGNKVPAGVDSVKFNIYKGSTALNEVEEVKASEGWTTTVKGLPRYKDGKAINYTVKEVAGVNYELKDSKKPVTDNKGNITFTEINKNTEKINFKVIKEWGNTPSELQFDTYVQLYKNDKKERDQVKLTANDNWETSFEGLPKYDEDGKEINYTVKEVNENDVVEAGEKITLKSYDYQVKHSKDGTKNEDIITNTVTNASNKTFTAKVTKKWEGGISTNDVIFTFTNKVDANKKRDLKITSNSFKGENTWTGEIQLPKYNDNDNSLAEYTVTEVAVPGFTTTGGENKVVTASNPNVEFTNTRKIQKITVTKDWGATPDVFIKDIKVVLTGEAKNLKDEQVKTIHRGEKTAEFTVPTHTNDGEEIKYTASEQGENNGKIIIDEKEFEVTHPEYNRIVNTYTGLEKDVVKLKIVKNWEGEGRVPVVFEVKDENGEKACDNIVLNSDPWTASRELPKWDKATGKLKTYTVNEVKTSPTFVLQPFINENDNRISRVDKIVTFTNTRVMRMLELEKEWIGEAAGQAKFKIEGGGVSKEITLTKNKNWRGSVDLPVYDLDGNVINYTITEESIKGYKAEKPSQNFNFVDPANPIGNRSVKFTNIELLKPQFTVHKTWVGEPASRATFGLFADGKSAPVDTLELTGENAKPLGSKVWEGVFTKEIPAKDINGNAINYVVKELDASGNSASDEVKLEGRTFKVVGTLARDTANTYNFKNTDITKTDISVTKTWLGKVPMYQLVHFGLYKVKADGLELVDNENYKLENTRTSVWTVSFKDVPTVDEKGNIIKYVIREVFGDRPDAVNTGDTVTLGKTNYKVSYDENGNITNTELIDLTVKKEWGKNVPDIAKHSVKFRITDDPRSAKKDKSFELNEANGWTMDFTELPLYDVKGEKINYTVVETEINGDKVDVGDDYTKYHHSAFEINVENAENITKSQTITIKNSIVNANNDDPDNRTINVVKGWSAGAERKSVTVKLYKLDTAKGEIVPVENGETELRDGNHWQTKFEVPKKDKDGNEILYYAFETAVGNAKVDESKLSPNLYNEGYQIGEYEVSIAELTSDEDGAEIGNYGFYILNTAHNKEVKPEEKVTINVTKKWLIPDNSEYVKPVRVRLFIKAGEYLVPVSDATDLTLDANNKWNGKFADLDKFNNDGDQIEYYVAEVGVGVYTKEIISLDQISGENGYMIGRYNVTIDGNGTNNVVITNDVALIDVTAVKEWIGATPRQAVEFTLYSKQGENLVPTDKTVTLNGTDENTVATFTELPRLDNEGKPVVYYVYETKIGATPIALNPTAVETMDYSVDVSGGKYSVVVTDNGTNGDKKVIISNTFIPNPVIPVIPGGDTPVIPGGTPIIPPVAPTPNPSTPVVDVPNDPSPQGPATPVNDGDEDNGVTEIDEDDVPQGDGKEVKKDNKANKDTVDIADNKAPKGTPKLPKTGGEAGNFLSIIGLGLIGLGLVIRRRR